MYCLLQRAFSLVSEDKCHGDYRAPLIPARHAGVLLACFSVDYRVLFEPLTEEIVQDGFQYYKTFYNAPLGIKVRKASCHSHARTRVLMRNCLDIFSWENDTTKQKLGYTCVCTRVVALIGATSWSYGRGSHRDHHQNTPLG